MTINLSDEMIVVIHKALQFAESHAFAFTKGHADYVVSFEDATQLFANMAADATARGLTSLPPDDDDLAF